MKKIFLREYSKRIGSDSWYKLLGPIQKKSFILDCISEFVVRTSEEEGVYFYQIMDLFHNKIGVNPYGSYISEIFRDKFGAQLVRDYTGKTMYLGVMLKCEIDLSKLHEITERYKTMEKKTIMRKDLRLKNYFEKATEEIGSDGWYKLLGTDQKKSFILDCISEFVVRTPEEKEKGVYFYQIVDLFHNKIGVKPYAPYISEIFRNKFGVQFVKDCTRKNIYLGVMLRNKTDDLDRLYAIRKKYVALGYKNRNCPETG